MKLIIAIVQDQDQNDLSRAFYNANIRATKLSTSGSFLRAGNTTFMIGVEESRIDEVLDIIKRCSQAREQYISAPGHLALGLESATGIPVKVEVGGATVFVLPVEQFLQF